MAISGQELRQKIKDSSSQESFSISGGTDVGNKGGRTRDYLKIDDVVNDPVMLEKVRRYMITRKGKQYAGKDAEDMVDEWVEHMRYFNTNEVSTVKEAMKVSNMSDVEKDAAADAYKLYDELGYFWQNDGLGGAVDGLWDYMKAVATSPSTYVGFGIGKGLGFGAQKLGVHAVRKQAMKNAIRNKTKNNATTLSQTKQMYKDLIRKNAKKDAWTTALTTGVVDGSVGAYQDITQQETELDVGSREEYNPYQTLVSSALQGGLSTLATRLAPEASAKAGMQGKVRQMRGVRYRRYTLDEGVDKEKAFTEIGEDLTKSYKGFREGAEEGRKLRMSQPDEWRSRFPDRVVDEPEGPMKIPDLKQRGEDFTLLPDRKIRAYETPFSPDLVDKILSSVRPLDFESKGIKVNSNINDAEKFALVVQNLPAKKLEEFRDMIWADTGLWLGDIADRVQMGRNIGNQLRFSASKFGEGLQLFRDHKHQRVISEALAEGELIAGKHTQNLLQDHLNRGVAGSDFWWKSDIGQGGQKAAYIANIWKRMLVSTPQTTAINVLGWGQLQLGQMVQELLQSAQLFALGTGQKLIGHQGAKETLRQSGALGMLQFEKFRRLLDPYSTKEMYIEALNANAEVKAKLYDTTAGGVIANADRFEFDKSSKLFRASEATVKMAQDISMVRLQDTLTKSQAFINNLDKHLRLDKGMSLNEALRKGDIRTLDADVMSKAGGDTLESVFSKDYRAKSRIGDQKAGEYFLGPVGQAIALPGEKLNRFGNIMASVVETISNNSMLGYYLPFGRFMNNVVATAYKWGPAGYLDAASALMKGEKMDATEAIARATVGSTAVALMIDNDKEKEKNGLAWNEIQFNDGSIVDGTNTFPLSLLMVNARIVRRMANGETISNELKDDYLKQIAIGQAAKDLQFGNDLTKLMQATNLQFGTNFDRGGSDADSIFYSSKEHRGRQDTRLGKVGQGLADMGIGNVVAGFTRPLDPLNRIVGVATGTDLLTDKRLPKSGFERLGMQAGRYVDNIFEGLSGEIHGESLQKATREERELRDPSIISGMAGFKELPTKTFSEMVFAMVDVPTWKTSMYTGVPEHDRFVNAVITPILEQKAEILLKSKRFRNSKNMEWKRDQVDKMLKSAKSTVNKLFFEGDPTSEEGLAYRKKKLDRTPRKFMKNARRMTDIQTSIRDLTEAEIVQLEGTIKYLRTDPGLTEN